MGKTFEKLLALHASPAIVGLKSANLISISLSDVPNLIEELDSINNDLTSKIDVRILRMDEKSALVLFYNKLKLIKTVFRPEAFSYLLDRGYPPKKDIDLYLDTLTSKINEVRSFPHEIGVFLGYDISDTIAFETNDRKCLYVGYWKVYSNVEEKKAIFDRYSKCRELVAVLLKKGYSIERIMKRV